MATYSWKPKVRNYIPEKEKLQLEREETTNHPLKPLVVSDVKKIVRDGSGKEKGKPKPAAAVDPLSSALDGIDPLSMFAAAAAAKPSRAVDPLSGSAGSTEVDSGTIDDVDMDESFEPWSSRRGNILATYTTSEKLSITTSFLSPADREKVAVKSQVAKNTVTDQVKNRLEQLDDFEEGSIKEMLNLSQQDYVLRIEELNNALVSAWEHDQKVKSLKIAIQCSKLLVDTSVIQFYPSKFVLITDILDTFGKLVFDRIRQKSSYIPPGSKKPQMLPENFTPEQVPESAKETCRNWFFKIASIRELIPRLYVEAAILKCYSFLTTGEYSQALNRLTTQIRGIGDPLVAIYGRAYLSRVGMAVAPQVKSHHINNLYDFINSFSQLDSDTVQNVLAMQRLDMPSYLHLYSPALDWLLQCIAFKAAENTLTEILGKCKKHCNNALLLNSIMSAFKPEFISRRAIEFLELIRECEEAGFPKHNLYKSLGTNLMLAAPAEQHRRGILNEVWKAVMKFQTPMEYITCAEVWVEFPCKHFSKKEVNTILNDIIKHMTPDRAFESHYLELQSVVSKILSQMHDFSILFSMTFDLTIGFRECKTILSGRCRLRDERDSLLSHGRKKKEKPYDQVRSERSDDRKTVLSRYGDRNTFRPDKMTETRFRPDMMTETRFVPI
ncbi:putative UPF0505 protein C16orf62 [Apostichopus japonicus]|uniref:Putative UPF0505 protein C16orf62 n=1 Tax=Stichopus japonicus TaxID=307972 RepID=A0A2G8JZF1_STIJA|nr:putative UPF0505 protein C16orf62 [Apostichopus japonicus]